MSEKQKGLIVYVYRKAVGYDASNNGISTRKVELTLVDAGEDTEIYEACDARPAVRLIEREINGRPYFYIEPVEGRDVARRGWMFGGNFIFCSDSRFTRITGAPIPIHDRQE